MRKVLFVICALLLGWMVWQVGPMELWQNLLDWNIVLLWCILIWLVGYLFNTVSFMQIIRCFQPEHTFCWKTIRRAVGLTIGGYALNYITPFGLLGGEPWRIHQLRQDMKPQDANSAVAYYAMMHVCSHVLFWLIGVGLALLYMGAAVYDYLPEIAWTCGAVACLIGVLLYVGVRKGWIRDLRWLLTNHPVQFWSALILELISRVVNVVEYWLLLQCAFGDNAMSTYVAAYLVVAFSSLFANVFFFSPLQMGTREGGILFVLEALLPSSVVWDLMPIAVSISFATRIREFFWIMVGMAMISRMKRKNDEKN